MMLDYVNFTGDTAFRDGVLVPFAREVLLFFDQHYPRGADGKLRLDPAQVLETWWIAVNPAPDVAGLRFCLDELLAMKAGTAEDQARWRKFRGEIPEVSLQTIEGRQAIAPAEKWEKKHNAENGELYPVFPFRCFRPRPRLRRPRGVDDAASLLQGRLRLCLLDAGPNPLGLCRQCRRGRRRTGAPLPHRFADVPLPALRPRRAGLLSRLRSFRRRLRGAAADARAGSGREDSPAAGVAGRLGCGFQTAPGRRRGADRHGERRQTDRLGHSSRHRGRRTWWSASRSPPGRLAPAFPPTRIRSAPVPTRTASNRFRGQIGRVTMFRGKLSPQTIRELAAGDRTQARRGPAGRRLLAEPESRATRCRRQPRILPARFRSKPGFVPEEKESGRVLDKLTAGKNDGFLLDTWPGLSLRLIAGNRQQHFPNVLKPGVWQHVAVVLDREPSAPLPRWPTGKLNAAG